jgi:hypothetical protein
MKLISPPGELLEIHLPLAGMLSELEWTLSERLSFEKASRIGKDRKCLRSQFLRLHTAQHTVPPASKESMVNLSGIPRDDAVWMDLT